LVEDATADFGQHSDERRARIISSERISVGRDRLDGSFDETRLSGRGD
jgi:hypothetical protein